jgi:succinate dehydrogenase hydrophobic anchor subunit
MASLNHWILERATAIFLLPAFLFGMVLVLYILIQDTNAIYFDTYTGINLLVLLAISKIAILKSSTMLAIPIGGIATLTIFIVLCIHLIKGVENIITDYVHNEKTKIFISIILLCIQIELIKHIYVSLFFL